VHNMCLVRPVLLYLNVHVLKVFYEQINSFIHSFIQFHREIVSYTSKTAN